MGLSFPACANTFGPPTGGSIRPEMDLRFRIWRAFSHKSTCPNSLSNSPVDTQRLFGGYIGRRENISIDLPWVSAEWHVAYHSLSIERYIKMVFRLVVMILWDSEVMYDKQMQYGGSSLASVSLTEIKIMSPAINSHSQRRLYLPVVRSIWNSQMHEHYFCWVLNFICRCWFRLVLLQTTHQFLFRFVSQFKRRSVSLVSYSDGRAKCRWRMNQILRWQTNRSVPQSSNPLVLTYLVSQWRLQNFPIVLCLPEANVSCLNVLYLQDKQFTSGRYRFCQCLNVDCQVISSRHWSKSVFSAADFWLWMQIRSNSANSNR